MNEAQIHLALNHAPIFLSIIGSGILLLGIIKKNDAFKNLPLYLLVAAALFTAPVFLTGEGAEELVEHLPGVNEPAIEKHEDMAKISLIIIIITGTMALLGLILKKNASMAKIVFAAALVFSLASFGSLVQTAHLGGLIRHSEIQNSATSGENANENGEEDDDDDKGKRNLADTTGSLTTDSLQQKEEKSEKGKEKKDDDDD